MQHETIEQSQTELVRHYNSKDKPGNRANKGKANRHNSFSSVLVVTASGQRHHDRSTRSKQRQQHRNHHHHHHHHHEHHQQQLCAVQVINQRPVSSFSRAGLSFVLIQFARISGTIGYNQCITGALKLSLGRSGDVQLTWHATFAAHGYHFAVLETHTESKYFESHGRH